VVASKAELKELAQGIVSASATAKLLGLDVVADYLDQAFDRVVWQERERKRAEAEAKEGD